jgi:hypothetical protein
MTVRMTVSEFLDLAKSHGVTLSLSKGEILFHHTKYSYESMNIVMYVDQVLEKSLIEHFSQKAE